MDVAIVGGGIGGLTLALALQKVGITSRVFEQTPELTGVGAGIGLWPGALKALRELDVSPWFWDLPVCPFRWAETADARVAGSPASTSAASPTAWVMSSGGPTCSPRSSSNCPRERW